MDSAGLERFAARPACTATNEAEAGLAGSGAFVVELVAGGAAGLMDGEHRSGKIGPRGRKMRGPLAGVELDDQRLFDVSPEFVSIGGFLEIGRAHV